MALYPGAVFKPTAYGGRTARNKQGRGILHVAVSNARSLPPWNGNTWHFYVAADGYCEQYVDTEFRAYAAADANDDAVLIETQGGLGSSAVLNAEKWTPAACERIADIMRWEAQQPGGAPLELLPDSKPGRRGWGPHRLGIQHSRGVGAVPGWLVAGGERWSSAVGKECPGDAKVRQIPQLIEMARSGAPAQEDDMDDKQAGQLQTVHDLLKSYLGPSIARQEERQLQFRQEANAAIEGLRSALAAIADNSEMTPAELEAAVAKALRENVVTIDVDVAPGLRTADIDAA